MSSPDELPDERRVLPLGQDAIDALTTLALVRGVPVTVLLEEAVNRFIENATFDAITSELKPPDRDST